MYVIYKSNYLNAYNITTVTCYNVQVYWMTKLYAYMYITTITYKLNDHFARNKNLLTITAMNRWTTVVTFITKYWQVLMKFIYDETYKHAFVLNALIVLLYSCLGVWETDQYLHFTHIVFHPLTNTFSLFSPCHYHHVFCSSCFWRGGGLADADTIVLFVITVGECYTYAHNYFVCDHSSYISLWKLYLYMCIVFIFMIEVRPVEPCTLYICCKYLLFWLRNWINKNTYFFFFPYDFYQPYSIMK